MCSFPECEKIEQFSNVIPPVPTISKHPSLGIAVLYLTLESPLSSRKLARIAALSFWTTARSSAIVFEARTLRMNCFTIVLIRYKLRPHRIQAYENSCWLRREHGARNCLAAWSVSGRCRHYSKASAVINAVTLLRYQFADRGISVYFFKVDRLKKC